MPRPTTRTLLGAGAVVVVAALLGAGGYLLTHAASAAPAPAAAAAVSDGAPAPGRHAGHGGTRARGARQAAGLLGRVEHGELVTAGAAGVSTTQEIQRGVITAVDPASITLRSADGFTATYAITPTTVVAPRRGRHGPASGTAAGTAGNPGGAGGLAAPGIDPPEAVPGSDPAAVPAGGVASLAPNQSVLLQGTRSPTGVTATRITPAKPAA